MDGFINAVSACAVLLLLMSVGYFMGRMGWMTAKEKKFLSKYIVNIAVPCNCVVGLLNNLSHDDLIQAGIQVVAGILGWRPPCCCPPGWPSSCGCPGSGWECSCPWPASPTPCSSASR